jgi:predicted transcriptional regulator/transcriptional regulator with XRE-family HTH domain
VAESKMYAGEQIRRFRKGEGLTQLQMARELGVSASYLNLLEHDRRAVSPKVLERLNDTFKLDLRPSGVRSEEAFEALNAAAADPVLQSIALTRAELNELSERQPRVADALVRLHGAYRDAVADAAELIDRYAGAEGPAGFDAGTAMEHARQFHHSHDNYFPALEAAADKLSEDLDLRDGEIFSSLKHRLSVRHRIAVKVAPSEVMSGALRRYDRHNRRVLLSELLAPAARIFQLAFQLALLEAGEAIDAEVARADPSTDEARRLLRISLANYVAAAVMMPYERFRADAAETRHDVDVLARRFSASIEQVCHRLTTLHRPGAEGVPFFLVRVDQAGNVSKRFGGRAFPFARLGGACPQWNIYDAFRAPDAWLGQIVQLPDGARFFTISHAVRRPGAHPGAPGQLLAIGLGCHAENAKQLVYADSVQTSGKAAAAQIGVNCRVCERPQCPRRAHPPLRRKIFVDENRRGVAAFSFRPD